MIHVFSSAEPHHSLHDWQDEDQGRPGPGHEAWEADEASSLEALGLTLPVVVWGVFLVLTYRAMACMEQTAEQGHFFSLLSQELSLQCNIMAYMNFF